MIKTIVILHGWNGRIEKWSPIKKLLESNGFKVLIPQLPGFTKDTARPWSLNDYSGWVLDYLKDNNISSAIFLCHSNGGRIGAKIAAYYPGAVEKLILVASAGIRTASHWKTAPLRIISKLGKSILKILPGSKYFTKVLGKLLYTLIREHDYEKASPILRQTMANIINENLKPTFEKITRPTLLICGKRDELTPPKTAVIIKNYISNSSIVWVEDAGHALPFTHSNQLINYVVDFVR